MAVVRSGNRNNTSSPWGREGVSVSIFHVIMCQFLIAWIYGPLEKYFGVEAALIVASPYGPGASMLGDSCQGSGVVSAFRQIGRVQDCLDGKHGQQAQHGGFTTPNFLKLNLSSQPKFCKKTASENERQKC